MAILLKVAALVPPSPSPAEGWLVRFALIIPRITRLTESQMDRESEKERERERARQEVRTAWE